MDKTQNVEPWIEEELRRLAETLIDKARAVGVNLTIEQILSSGTDPHGLVPTKVFVWVPRTPPFTP